ncbi:MAG: ribose 5-phosphate isomerase B [Candidatus Omnitrophica bacterium]|nr:ribose 5-phosphate isomerase B [Candidatus Omnitrophota bacterium]
MDRIIIGSDHAGFSLKEKLKVYLKKNGYAVTDLGTYSKERCDYPEFAFGVAGRVSSGKFKRGILICKSGIGNSIVANRFRGVRAALCYNIKAARLSREHNDSNILVLGSGFVSQRSAVAILRTWLHTDFQGGRHKRRLELIKKLEEKIRRDTPH